MIINKIPLSKAKKLNLFKILKKQKVIIIENCFSKNKMLLAREELINFFKLKKFRYSNSRNKNLFHRWDFNPKKAKFKRIMLSASFKLKYIKYFKNCIDILNKGILLKKNFTNNYAKYYGKKKITFDFIPRGSYYPSGGGYYQLHNDSFSDEKILDVIPISILNEDYNAGGLYVKIKNKEHNIEQDISCGNIVLMDVSVNHGIKPVDKKKKLSKKSFKGRLSLISVSYIKKKFDEKNSKRSVAN